MTEQLVYLIPVIIVFWGCASLFIVRKTVKSLPIESRGYKKAIERMIKEA